jgi:uncharacterized membrane protein
MMGACCVVLATLVPVALYQTGVISQLPDPPGRIFDSELITGSAEAHAFGIPDALLGLGSFGMTFALMLFANRSRVAGKLLGAKLTLDLTMAAFNTARQVVRFRKLCSWCTGTALATVAMTFEGREAIRQTWAQKESMAASSLQGTREGLR